MPLNPLDVVTQQVDVFTDPTLSSRIVALAPAPTGGYYALVQTPLVPGSPAEISTGFLLRFDDDHGLLWTVPFNVIDLNEPQPTRPRVTPVALSVGRSGVFVAGTVSGRALPPSAVAFVAKFSFEGSFEWVRTYGPYLFDGCKVPDTANGFARSLVRLPPPDDDRMMLLFHTTHRGDGTVPPASDDSLSAAIFVLDEDGERAVPFITRLFGSGQAIPSRLRILPTLGPTIVGQTRSVDPHVSPWDGWIARVSLDGMPLGQARFDLRADTVLKDVAESPSGIVSIGSFHRTFTQAFVASHKSNGLATWAAEVRPPEDSEAFATELNVLEPLDDRWIAAGAVNFTSDKEKFRPWLAGLGPDAHGFEWQKSYPVNQVDKASSFHSLWLRPDSLAVVGGEIARRAVPPRGSFVDGMPFLAVSETTPLTPDLHCSAPTPAVLRKLDFSTGILEAMFDRMPATHHLWTGGSFGFAADPRTLCRQGQEPPG